MILAAGNHLKKSAPNLVSIMFTDDDGDFKVQVACSSPKSPELDSSVTGPGADAVTDSPELNLVMGATILQGRTDFPSGTHEKLRCLIRLVRYDSLANRAGYTLPGVNVAKKVCEHHLVTSDCFFSRVLRMRSNIDSETMIGGTFLRRMRGDLFPRFVETVGTMPSYILVVVH